MSVPVRRASSMSFRYRSPCMKRGTLPMSWRIDTVKTFSRSSVIVFAASTFAAHATESVCVQRTARSAWLRFHWWSISLRKTRHMTILLISSKPMATMALSRLVI